MKVGCSVSTDTAVKRNSLLSNERGDSTLQVNSPKTPKKPMGEFQTIMASFGTIPSENYPISLAQEPRKNLKFRRNFIKTGLPKKQKVTE